MRTPAEERADDRNEDQPEQLAGPIVFDHHLARRRRALRPALVHLVSLVMMLGGLALLVLYQERCAAQVVRAIGLVAQPPGPRRVRRRGPRIGRGERGARRLRLRG